MRRSICGPSQSPPASFTRWRSTASLRSTPLTRHQVRSERRRSLILPARPPASSYQNLTCPLPSSGYPAAYYRGSTWTVLLQALVAIAMVTRSLERHSKSLYHPSPSPSCSPNAHPCHAPGARGLLQGGSRRFQGPSVGGGRQRRLRGPRRRARSEQGGVLAQPLMLITSHTPYNLTLTSSQSRVRGIGDRSLALSGGTCRLNLRSSPDIISRIPCPTCLPPRRGCGGCGGRQAPLGR